MIVTATLLIVVVGGVLMRVLDHTEYGSIWLGMWWVLETVTTVGYGDLTPEYGDRQDPDVARDVVGRRLPRDHHGRDHLGVRRPCPAGARGRTSSTRQPAQNARFDDRFDKIDAQLQQLRELLERTPPSS